MSTSSKSFIHDYGNLSRENSFNQTHQTGYSRKDSEVSEERIRTPEKNGSRYDKPFILSSISKDNSLIENTDATGYTKREQEIIKKYTGKLDLILIHFVGIIETLQSQLVKRNAKIAILEEKLSLYAKAYGDIGS
jgi:hypothetical protein